MVVENERKSRLSHISLDFSPPEWSTELRGAFEATRVRKAFRAFVRLHAEPDSDVDGAETIFAELIANAVRHGGGAAWISVDWRNAEPILVFKDCGPGFHGTPRSALSDLFAQSGRGLAIIQALAHNLELGNSEDSTGGAFIRVILPVSRRLTK